MKLPRVTRLLQLLGILQGGKTYNVTGLAQACGVSRRTIFRDLDVLREAGVPLVFNEELGHYYLNGRNFLPPTNFTAEEALALMVLCHELGGTSPLPFLAPARSAALKLESCLPHVLREHVRELVGSVEIRLEPKNPLTDSGSVYRQLLDAIGKRQELRIEYQSFAEREHITTRLSPYRLLFSRRSWYCIGRSSLHRGTRTFNVGRITTLTPLATSYQIPSGFSLERYLGNAWHLIPEPGPDRDVVIRFDPLVAGNVAEVSWHKSQRQTFLPDGSLEFRVTVSGIQEIAWWVLGYGDQAEVLEPLELRELVQQRARRMCERYHASAVVTAAADGQLEPSVRRPRKRDTG
ncbi:MAG: transcriptional regulator [Planctomycetaceae bacterium]|nr:transcriptional regulator [Planctomycetaceae bacterium]